MGGVEIDVHINCRLLQLTDRGQYYAQGGFSPKKRASLGLFGTKVPPGLVGFPAR